MQEGQDSSIDQAQVELSAEAKAEKTGVIRGAEDIFKFGGLVDSFQSLEKSLKLNTAEAKKYYQTGKKEVSDLLLKMAARGKWLTEEADKEGAYSERWKKPEGENIIDIAENLRSKLAGYSEKLPVISSVVETEEKAFPFLTKLWEVEASAEVINARPNLPDVLTKALSGALYGTDGAGGALSVLKITRNNRDLPSDFLKEVDTHFSEDKIQKILERKIIAEQQNATFKEKIDGASVERYARIEPSKKKKDEWEVVFTPAGEALPKEKQQQILMVLGGVRTAAVEQAESASCLKVTEPFWSGKTLFENGLFEEAKRQFEAFLKDNHSSEKGYQKQKASYEAQANDYIGQIEKLTSGNRDFFEGQNLAVAGDIFGAKHLLKKYLEDHKEKKEGRQDFSASARELLKRIALTQCADAREKFKIHTEPPENEKSAQNPAYAKFCKYRDAITQIEQEIIAGKYYDFTDAYNAIAAKIPGGFDAKEDLNVMTDQVTLDKGRNGLLELARKYREKGKLFGDAKFLSVAEQYFTQYFGKKLEETSKTVTIEEIRSHYEGRPKFTDDINARYELEKEKYERMAKLDPQWTAAHPWNEKEVRQNIKNSAFSELQREEILKKQNSNFNLNSANVGGGADQAAWGEFMSMKGMQGQGKWNEMFSLSDETVGRLVKDMPVDIAMIAAAGAISAATGGAAAGIAAEGVAGYLGRRAAMKGSQAILEVFEREIVAGATRSAGRQALAYGTGLLVESATFTVSHSALNAIRTGELSVLHGENFREEWLSNLQIMGLLGLVGRASHALQLGRVSSLGAEMVGMGALNGRLTPEDWAMVIGLKIGHAGPELKEAAAEYKKKKAEKNWDKERAENEALEKASEAKTDEKIGEYSKKSEDKVARLEMKKPEPGMGKNDQEKKKAKENGIKSESMDISIRKYDRLINNTRREFLSGGPVTHEAFEAGTDLLISGELLLVEMGSRQYGPDKEIDEFQQAQEINKFRKDIEGLRLQLQQRAATMDGFDPEQYNEKLRTFAIGSDTIYDRDKGLDIFERGNFGNETRTELYERVILFKKAERILRNERSIANEEGLGIDGFKSVCTTESNKRFVEYLRGNISEADFLREARQDELLGFKEQGSQNDISSVEKLLVFRKLEAQRKKIAEQSLSDEERKAQLTIIEEGMQMLRDGRFGSYFSTGTNSLIWDGLANTNGQLVSSGEMKRRGIERRIGEGELGGASGAELGENIYGGIGVDGFGTARTYSALNASEKGYLNAQYLSDATLEKRVNIYRKALKKAREEGLKYISIIMGVNVEISTLELELAQYERAKVSREKIGTVDAPYPVIIGFTEAGGNMPELGDRKYRGRLSGETVFPEVIDLTKYAETVYVPHKNIAHARQQLERIFGKERASKIKINSLEAVDMVGVARGGPYVEVFAKSYVHLTELQRYRMNRIEEISKDAA